jgi:hypothetical protein
VQSLTEALQRSKNAEKRLTQELQGLRQAELLCKSKKEQSLRDEVVNQVVAALDHLQQQQQNIQDRLEFYVQRKLPDTTDD